MQLSEFDYELPEELIAQYPLASRTSSRLLEVQKTAMDSVKLNDLIFTDITKLLKKGDLLIFNDTKVIPARVFGTKETGGKAELLVERILSETTLLAQIRASKSPAINSTLFIGEETSPIAIKVLERQYINANSSTKEKSISPFYLLEFPGDCLEILENVGELPLPPYIAHQATSEDLNRYQTVIAKYPGAVAAPTAGLHFDEALIETLKEHGVQIEFVTLHVGAGTFTPVRVENINDHQMHFEKYSIPENTRLAIETTKASGNRIICVGTTSLRAVESAAKMGESGDTNLFITPGYQFQVVDALITNFHLPKSTLMMLVSAFAGIEPIRQAYQHAIINKYRFFSYGDAMLLHRSV
jgi:S-adenosylmethionine:tRNA ribosyltransferase-isomerase